jgi:hypothetical protein
MGRENGNGGGDGTLFIAIIAILCLVVYMIAHKG